MTTTSVNNNISFLNSFIDKIKASQDSIFCDATCQYNKKEEELKRKYDISIVDYKQAPDKIKNTYKDYYVFKNGEASYEEEMEKKYNIEAIMMIKKFKETVEEIKDTITKNLEIYNVNMKYLTDIYPAFYLYYENNLKTKKEIKENRATILTNNRKSYYENEGIDTSSKMKQIMYILYLVIAVMASFYIFIYSDKKIPVKIVLSVFIILYPFYISYLYEFLKNAFTTAFSLFPTNIYLYKTI